MLYINDTYSKVEAIDNWYIDSLLDLKKAYKDKFQLLIANLYFILDIIISS